MPDQGYSTEAFVRSLIESLPVELWAMDSSGHYTIQNSISRTTWGDHVGLTLEEASGSPRLLRQWQQTNKRAAEGETVQAETAYKVNGEWRDYLAVVAPVRSGAQTIGIAGLNMDVTKSKRLEEGLREAQARYEELVDAVDGIVWEADPITLAFTFVSKKAERLLGFPTDNWINDTSFWSDRAHVEDRQFVVDFSSKMTAQCKDHEIEYRMIASDGRVVWLRDIVTVTGANGVPTKLRGVMVDISESKRSERVQSSIYRIAEAVSSVENLDELFPAIHEIVGGLMPAGNFVIALLDANGESISFPYWRHETGQAPTPETTEYARQVIQTGEALQCSLEQLNEPDKAARLELMDSAPATWLGVPLIAKSRTIGAMAVQSYSEGFRYSPEEKNILLLISWQVAMAIERKAADDALRQSEHRYRVLVENSQGLLCTHDLTGKLLSINMTAARLLGYQPSELVGRNLVDALAPAARPTLQHYLDTIQTTGNYKGVMRVVTRSGEERFFAYNNSLQKEAGRPHYILGNAQDITDRRRVDRALKERTRISELIAEISSYVTGKDSLESIVRKCGECLANRLTLPLLRVWTREAATAALTPLVTAGRLNTMSAAVVDEILGKCELDNIYSMEGPYSTTPIGGALTAHTEVEIGYFAGFPLHAEGRSIGLMALLTSQPLPESILSSIVSIADTLAQFIQSKKAEQALETSHGLLRAVIEGTTDAIFVKDRQGRYLMINQAGAMVSGKDADYHIGRLDSDVFSPESTQAIRASDETVFETGETRTFEEHLEINGRMKIFQATKGLYKDAAGNVLGLIGIARDVTKRIRTEEALRESEHLFRTLMNTVSAGIYIYRDNRVLYVNSAAEQISGYSREEVLESDLFIMVDPSHREFAINNAKAREKRESPLNGYDLKIMRKDGGERWLNVSGASIKFEGEPAVLLTAFDITQLRLASDALAAEKERLATTLKSIADGVIATDTAGKVVLFNRVAEVMTGWTQEEATGTPIAEILRLRTLKKRRAKENPVERLLRGGGSGRLNQSVIVSRDGVERIIADTTAPIRSQDGNLIGFVLVLRDVTEARKLEEDMLRASKLESVGLLAGGIAHDFNNILTSILGNVSFAKSLIKGADHILSRLDAAEQAALRARDLTQQLLTFSKGGAPIKRTVYIGDLVREASGFALTGSNLRCEYALPRDLWALDIDEGQIGQVIHNLVLNGQQAMPQGGAIMITAENVELGHERGSGRLLQQGRYVKITVVDHGIGIAEEHIDKIFDPYFTTKQKGSGLGLATSYSIVKNHGGQITVHSRQGQGASVSVYLPASAHHPIPLEIPAERAGLETGRVLVMDDEDIIRELLQQVLTHLGYDTVPARDGAEALDLFKKARDIGMPFDAVILDLTIPGGMGGKEVINKLIEIDPGVRAIVSSGYSNDPVMADYRRHGFMGVMIKPYKGSELRKALLDVLRKG